MNIQPSDSSSLLRSHHEANGKDRVRLDAIDGLRAIAVLSVIAFHFNIGIAPTGFIGVDIFFVISGYVIALSLTQNSSTSTLQYIVDFYKRRILRIMPALIVCLTVVGVFSQLFIPDSWLSRSNNKTGLFAFFGFSNFALLSGVDGYFNDRTEFNPFLHTWSLAVEEQFYLFFPLLFLPWLKRTSRSGIRAFPLNNFVLIVSLVSLAWVAIETSRDPQTAFYMLPSRFWELAAGAVLLQCHSTGRCIPQSLMGNRIAVILALVLIIPSLFWTNIEAFPFPWALLPVGGTLAFICAARSPSASNSLLIRILKTRLPVYLGKASYSLYLWHWPVVVLMRWTVGFDTASHLAFAVVSTLILGLASYHFVEKPFLKSLTLRRWPAWQIVSKGALFTIGAAMVFALNMQYGLHLSVVAQQAGWKNSDMPAYQNSSFPNSGKITPTLWVIGDSHAGAYSGMVRQAAAETGMKVQIKGMSGCSVANLRQPYPDTHYCRDHLNKLFDELSKHYTEGSIVFLASLRGQRLSDQWGMYEPEKLNQMLNSDRSVYYREALDQSREIIERLLSLGFKVVIDTPKPVFRAPPFRCADWFNHMNPVCTPGFEVSATELKSFDKQVLESLHTLKSEYPGLVIWDPFQILCPESTCVAFRNGKPLFFDQDHLSGYGNQLLVPSFSALLSNINHNQEK